MATTTKYMRKLPGRIVGETVDSKGNTAYVLSLQAREQHIRREKASSNICSNEALCALTASVYMAAMGPRGLQEVASQSRAKAHYLARELCDIPGVSLLYNGEFFHEFVTLMPKTKQVLVALEKQGILGGLPLEEGILWCVTEKVSKIQLDQTVDIVREVLK
jgi:glycine dehydrogenase subunit 1